MANVTVKLFANLRESTGKSKIETSGKNLSDVLNALAARYEGLGDLIFDGKNLHPFIHVMVNGISVKDKDGLGTLLSDGDEIALFPPVSGG